MEDSLNIWGKATSLLAELWAIYFGIIIAVNARFVRLIIESDCLTTINLLTSNEKTPYHLYATLIDSCRTKLGDLHQVRIQHIHREGNCCVDSLAKAASQESFELVYYDHVPTFLNSFFVADYVGISQPRNFGIGWCCNPRYFDLIQSSF